MSASKSYVTVGQWVDIAMMIFGQGNRMTISFGDATPDLQYSELWGCNLYSVPFVKPHNWDQPGRYVVTLTTNGSSDCSVDPESFVEQSESVTVEVDVLRDTGSNGPELPSGYLGPTDRPAVFDLFVRDVDGQMRNAIIDWGDGTAPVYRRLDGQAQCSYGTTPSTDTSVVSGEHVYEPTFAPTATVTVTLYSTGCDEQSE
jgi:hypothetical protein